MEVELDKSVLLLTPLSVEQHPVYRKIHLTDMKSVNNPQPVGRNNSKPMSYIQSLHHIIIRTKYSENVLSNEHSDELYRYISGYMKNKKSFLYRINGMPDHLHILVGIHATVALADFVKELKTSTNSWIKNNKDKFPKFKAWGEKYAAFTIRYQEKDIVIEYIKNQREHHKKLKFKDEYRKLIVENGIYIDERFFLSD